MSSNRRIDLSFPELNHLSKDATNIANNTRNIQPNRKESDFGGMVFKFSSTNDEAKVKPNFKQKAQEKNDSAFILNFGNEELTSLKKKKNKHVEREPLQPIKEPTLSFNFTAGANVIRPKAKTDVKPQVMTLEMGDLFKKNLIGDVGVNKKAADVEGAAGLWAMEEPKFTFVMNNNLDVNPPNKPERFFSSMLNNNNRAEKNEAAANEPEPRQSPLKNGNNQKPTYDEILANLLLDEDSDFIANFEVFECPICFTDIEAGQGVILKNCFHKFCKDCVSGTIEHSDTCEVKCPNGEENCEKHLQDCEVRSLAAPDVLKKHLDKSLKLYQGASENAVQCLTPDCRGIIEVDRNVREYTCLVCAKVNCIPCKASHPGKSCQVYQNELKLNEAHQRENVESESAIKNLIAKGEAMNCPRCGIAVMKEEGCDWIVCTSCKLEICWCTKKPRKPFTKQDGSIIDGCHCKENGKLCHPQCRNCH